MQRVTSSYQTSPYNNETNATGALDSGNDLGNVDLLVDQSLSSDFESLLKNESLFGGGGTTSNNLMGSGGGGSPFELTSSFNNLSQSDSITNMLTINNKNVSASSSANNGQLQQQSKPLSFDYLYEFSETRKVLEEFFTCQTNNDKILEKLSDFNESDDIGDDSFENNFSNVLSNNDNDDIIPPTNTTTTTLGGAISSPTSTMTASNMHHSSAITNNTSYIGQKLAGNNKYNNTTNNDHHLDLQHPPTSYHQHTQILTNSTHDRNQKNNMDDLYEHHDIELFLDSGSRSSGELADNEVEHGHTRNFTLSPETTDYDSNCGDLDSEVSLRYTGLGGEFGEFSSPLYCNFISERSFSF